MPNHFFSYKIQAQAASPVSSFRLSVIMISGETEIMDKNIVKIAIL